MGTEQVTLDEEGGEEHIIAAASIEAQARSRQEQARRDVAAVFEQLSARLRVPFDAVHRVAILSELASVQEGEPWERVIARVAGDLGMVASVVTYSPAQYMQLTGYMRPMLTRIVQPDGAVIWFIINPGETIEAEIVQVGPAVRSRAVLGGVQLAAMLGVAEAEPLSWLALDVALPLETMKLPPGFHGPKDSKSIIQLKALLRSERQAITTVLIYALVIGLFTLTTPLAVQAVVNTITFGTVLQPLIVLTLVLGVGLSVSGVLRVFQSYVVEFIQRRMFVVTVTDLSHRLPRVHVSAHEARYTPELVNRFFDIVTVQKAASSLLLDALGLVLQTVIGLIVLAFYHPMLLAFDILLVTAMAFVILVLGKKAIKTSLEESNNKYAVASWLETLVRNASSFKSRQGNEVAATRANTLALSYLEARGDHYKIVLRQLIGVILIQALFSAALLGLGGYLVLKGQLTIGQLVAAELIVTSIVANLVKFGKHFETFYDLSAGVYKIGELVGLPLEPVTGEAVQRSEHAATVTLDDVTYGYPGAKPLFQEVSLALTPGERVVIAGPSGSGKSVLLQLLYGMRSPSSGRILYDGANLKGLSLPSLRAEVAFVGTPELIEGTVEENIRMGQWDISREELRQIVELVGLKQTLSRLPSGLDSPLTALGAPLSEGERARLMFARAVAQRPRLILIDAMLDSFNMREREALLKALSEHAAHPTLVIASRCPDVLSQCDRAFRINKRRVEEVKR